MEKEVNLLPNNVPCVQPRVATAPDMCQRKIQRERDRNPVRDRQTQHLSLGPGRKKSRHTNQRGWDSEIETKSHRRGTRDKEEEETVSHGIVILVFRWTLTWSHCSCASRYPFICWPSAVFTSARPRPWVRSHGRLILVKSQASQFRPGLWLCGGEVNKYNYQEQATGGQAGCVGGPRGRASLRKEKRGEEVSFVTAPASSSCLIH